MTAGLLQESAIEACPLTAVEQDVRRYAARGIRKQVVLDLDDTLFLVRPRKEAIFREMAEALVGHPSLAAALVVLAAGPIPYDVREALRQVGIHEAHHVESLQEAFYERFLHGAYVRHDSVNEGASGYVGRLAEAGARIVYLSGRPEEMASDTRRSLEEAGFPVPGREARLILKAAADVHLGDVEYKRVQAARLAPEAPCAAVFDNEPANLNAIHAALPDARYFLLETDHSPSPPPLVMPAHRLRDFRTERERLAAALRAGPAFGGGALHLEVSATPPA
ncbi:MAG: HAD family hydrolase [Candidatus Sericytochromatia bacterium]|nr:HAD family hydrolase [Candidatus Sericytochromatia bacterium]